LALHTGDVATEVDIGRKLTLGRRRTRSLGHLAGVRELVDVTRAADGTRQEERHQRPSWPGIQSVPASGTRAIAAASTVSATRSSGSRLWTCDFPHARASVCASSVRTRR